MGGLKYIREGYSVDYYFLNFLYYADDSNNW